MYAGNSDKKRILGGTIAAYVAIIVGLLETLLFLRSKIGLLIYVFVLMQIVSAVIFLFAKKGKHIVLLKFYAGYQGFLLTIYSMLLLLAFYSIFVCMSNFTQYHGFVARDEKQKDIASTARMYLLIYTSMIICHTIIAAVSLHTANHLVEYFMRREDSDLASIDF
uniref:DUF4149 domain-containing protein n=1 Tax=Steinernema glaseri TaxID=37863 RepID=A0A1I8AVF1_9BILA